VLISHICNHLAQQKKHFHVTSASSIAALSDKVNYTMGWTGMGKALGTKKQILCKVRKNTQARKAWMDTEVIIIKDITLLSAFMFDIMDFLAKEIRKDLKPFGGIQMILVGEPHGLCPPFTQTVCCPYCGQNHRLTSQSHSSASAIGTHITCSNELCQSMFINTWLLYPFEIDIWSEAQLRYFPLRENYVNDQGLSELLKYLSMTPPLSPQGRELLKSRESKEDHVMQH
jgi:hypothetical protein